MRLLALVVLLSGCAGFDIDSATGRASSGSCMFAFPATAIGCTASKCLLCTAEGMCRWVGIRDCRSGE